MNDYDRPYRTYKKRKDDDEKSAVTVTQMIAAAVIIAAVCIVKMVSPTSYAQMETLFEEIMADNRTYEKVAEVFNNFTSGVNIDDLAETQETEMPVTEEETNIQDIEIQNMSYGMGNPETETDREYNAIPTAVVFPVSLSETFGNNDDYSIEPPENCTFAAFALTTDISYPLESEGTVSSEFGYRTDPFTGARAFHKGIDIASPYGTAILSAFDGMVIETGENSSSGKYVLIQHDNGLVTAYYHCSKICTSIGTLVEQGEKVAEVGSTGNSTGPHLHFEIRIDGVRYDPSYVL